MPVVTLYFDRLRQFLKGRAKTRAIVEKIPYLGLDIEELGEDYIRVEYNPNRPDFSTDVGVARALNGLFGYEVGAPRYDLIMGSTRVMVDESVASVRPYIVGLRARGVQLDDESIRQLIAMQEDLHNGIGRRRRKVSIGIHNMDVLDPPFRYGTAAPDFRFPPLGSHTPMSMAEMLEKTEAGRAYGHLVKGFTRYPVLMDVRDEVLSFPPVINSELTRVTASTRNLFIDVTGTDFKAVDDALAIIASTLYEICRGVEVVIIEYPNSTLSCPNMKPHETGVDIGLVNRLLGLNLSREEAADCLGRGRISVIQRGGSLVALVPRYRVDVLHPVDIVEDVAIGYGLDNLGPTIPASGSIGGLKPDLQALSVVREVMISMGLIEVMNFSLTGEELLAKAYRSRAIKAIRVESPKSREHELLRDSLLPSLLHVLSHNVHEEYPQRIFELSKVFQRDPRLPSKIREEYHVAAASAHKGGNYSEAKSLLASLLSHAFAVKFATPAASHPSFAKGRCAAVRVGRSRVGFVGEVHPEVLEGFQLRTPVTAFELTLTPLLRGSTP